MSDVTGGARVTLSVPSPDDEDAFLAAVAASRRLHEPWVSPPSTPAAFAAYLDRVSAPSHEGFFVRVEDGLVGVVNINNIVLGALRSGFLGYYAFAGREGRGLMTQGLRLVLHHAFDVLDLHRLEANIQPGNASSLALVRRLGFVREGFSERYLRIGGEWRDHERWAITVERFDSAGGSGA